MTVDWRRWWASQSPLYAAGRNNRLDVLIRVTMILGGATIAESQRRQRGSRTPASEQSCCGCCAPVRWSARWPGPRRRFCWQGGPPRGSRPSLTPVSGRPLTVLDDLQLTFAGRILFALVGGFATIHVPNGGLVLHAAFAASFTVTAAIGMIVDVGVNDEIAVLGAAVWLWVLVSTPLVVRRVWTDAQ